MVVVVAAVVMIVAVPAAWAWAWAMVMRLPGPMRVARMIRVPTTLFAGAAPILFPRATAAHLTHLLRSRHNI
ncbi:hypothetical protein [Hyphomicrobium sp. CS1BSMeth3]|uniref:hypothetical protein n=1 Tax=Hyphomicrobium sp. CS1BSMeth3 TaxID=1892844 RepID=UPI001FCD1D1C|nr:hypothetical protein [Hyphomicrobium sp. CS1BSMeth3]